MMAHCVLSCSRRGPCDAEGKAPLPPLFEPAVQELGTGLRTRDPYAPTGIRTVRLPSFPFPYTCAAGHVITYSVQMADI